MGSSVKFYRHYPFWIIIAIQSCSIIAPIPNLRHTREYTIFIVKSTIKTISDIRQLTIPMQLVYHPVYRHTIAFSYCFKSYKPRPKHNIFPYNIISHF